MKLPCAVDGHHIRGVGQGPKYFALGPPKAKDTRECLRGPTERRVLQVTTGQRAHLQNLSSVSFASYKLIG